MDGGFVAVPHAKGKLYLGVQAQVVWRGTRAEV